MKINTDSLPPRDLLNRNQFAVEIAKGLKASFTKDEDSFVVGINGRWGSGKSTLLYYLEKALCDQVKEKTSTIFRFNPWMFAGSDDIGFTFLTQLAIQLQVPLLKTKISKLANAVSAFGWLKYVNATAGTIQESLENVLSNIPLKATVQELKHDIDRVIVTKGIRIFVFIDDLDRLSPSDVMQIFQIVKLTASFKNTVFVLSYDKEVIQEILEQHHRVNGEKYLEKIIQVDYRIPDLLEEVLKDIFFKSLRELLREFKVENDEVEFSIIWNVYRFKFYFSNLRDVYRYFNALRLRLPSLHTKVNVYQFMVIEGIRIFDYQAYEFIQNNHKRSVIYGTKPQGNLADEILSNETTRAAYNYLFFKKIGSPYSISDPKYFDRYFALSVSMVDPLDEITERFIHDRTSRTHLMEMCTADGSIEELLKRLQRERVDLSAVNHLIVWRPETERVFLECKDLFIETIEKILCDGQDLGESSKYLFSILPADDGYFNPARFYLLVYLNSMIPSTPKSIFHKNYDVVENQKIQLENGEKDLLKRHHSDQIIFSRPYTRTDFFHRLFLTRYKKYYSIEYSEQLKIYLRRQENLFPFLSLMMTLDEDDIKINLECAINILDEIILNELESIITSFVKSGLAVHDRKLVLAFEKSIPELRSKFVNAP